MAVGGGAPGGERGGVKHRIGGMRQIPGVWGQSPQDGIGGRGRELREESVRVSNWCERESGAGDREGLTAADFSGGTEGFRAPQAISGTVARRGRPRRAFHRTRSCQNGRAKKKPPWGAALHIPARALREGRTAERPTDLWRCGRGRGEEGALPARGRFRRPIKPKGRPEARRAGRGSPRHSMRAVGGAAGGRE